MAESSASSELRLVATARTEFGKGAARRVRRAHQIPAVLYGHGTEPVHVALPGHETMLALKHANALLTIELDGTAHLAIAKDVQREPVKNVIEHVDLLIVQRGEKIVVEVPVRVEGTPAPGTVVVVDLQTVALEAEATGLPESLVVSVEGLEAGAHLTGGTLPLPAGVTFAGDPDTIVVAVTGPQALTAEDLAEDAAAAEA